MIKNPNIYVIIVTYNGRQWVDRCFGSLRTSNIPIHTFVVDNCSTDGTADLIEQGYPEAMLIRSPENLGFGKGNNLGISYAMEQGADYVFLLNQDAWIEAQTLELLVAGDDNCCGIISPTHFDGTGLALDKDFKKYLFGYGVQSKSEKQLLEEFTEPKDVVFVNAAAWLVPCRTIEIVGGFDPFFFHYGEDNNYCHRVLYHRLKIRIVPRSVIYHDRQGANKPMRNTWIGRHLQISYADPNLSILAITLGNMGKHVRFMSSIVYYLVRGRRDDAKNIIGAYRNLLTHWSGLLLSRKTNKTKGPHWVPPVHRKRQTL